MNFSFVKNSLCLEEFLRISLDVSLIGSSFYLQLVLQPRNSGCLSEEDLNATKRKKNTRKLQPRVLSDAAGRGGDDRRTSVQYSTSVEES